MMSRVSQMKTFFTAAEFFSLVKTFGYIAKYKYNTAKFLVIIINGSSTIRYIIFPFVLSHKNGFTG